MEEGVRGNTKDEQNAISAKFELGEGEVGGLRVACTYHLHLTPYSHPSMMQNYSDYSTFSMSVSRSITKV